MFYQHALNHCKGVRRKEHEGDGSGGPHSPSLAVVEPGTAKSMVWYKEKKKWHTSLCQVRYEKTTWFEVRPGTLHPKRALQKVGGVALVK